MSTESGLPDFRSKEGLWRHRDPREYASVEALLHHENDFREFYRWRVEQLVQVRPNRGHELLARWESRGVLAGIITQNVDGLHQRAGSRRVVELHGSLRNFPCMACGEVFPCEVILESLACPACGGALRPGVVLFGEALPETAMAEAETLAKSAPLFLVLGSSLLVSPANWYPERAKRAGARLVIVNNEPTPLDALADEVIRRPIGETLSAIQDACFGQD